MNITNPQNKNKHTCVTPLRDYHTKSYFLQVQHRTNNVKDSKKFILDDTFFL